MIKIGKCQQILRTSVAWMPHHFSQNPHGGQNHQVIMQSYGGSSDLHIQIILNQTRRNRDNKAQLLFVLLLNTYRLILFPFLLQTCVTLHRYLCSTTNTKRVAGFSPASDLFSKYIYHHHHHSPLPPPTTTTHTHTAT